MKYEITAKSAIDYIQSIQRLNADEVILNKIGDRTIVKYLEDLPKNYVVTVYPSDSDEMPAVKLSGKIYKIFSKIKKKRRKIDNVQSADS